MYDCYYHIIQCPNDMLTNMEIYHIFIITATTIYQNTKITRIKKLWQQISSSEFKSNPIFLRQKANIKNIVGLFYKQNVHRNQVNF